jgi:hypothetical protein
MTRRRPVFEPSGRNLHPEQGVKGPHRLAVEYHAVQGRPAGELPGLGLGERGQVVDCGRPGPRGGADDGNPR